MTPERAKVLSRRWLAVAVVFIAGGLALDLTGVDEVMPLPYAIGGLFLLFFFDHRGWRDGYLARVAQEERARAGEAR
jgi:hypothetical protein